MHAAGNNNAVFFGGSFGTGDVADGGSGTGNQLGLQGDYSAGVTLSAANVSGMETVAVMAGSGATRIVTTDDLIATGKTMSFYASESAAAFELDARAETSAAIRVFGGSGADTIRTGGGDDAIYFGPGRYDPNYEDKGQDYPIGYVRWTERRNMQSFLDLIADRRLDMKALTTHRFPIDEGRRAYELVTGASPEPAVGIILTYDQHGDEPAAVAPTKPKLTATGRIGLGVIGTGQFAKGVLLPGQDRQ